MASTLKKKAAETEQTFDKSIEGLRELLSSKDLDNIPDIDELRERLEGGLSDLEGAAQNAAKEAKRKSKKAVRAANELVHNEPWQAVGVALVVGAIAGALVCRR